MSDAHTYSSDVAFTPAVKAIQTRKGSREGYAQAEARGGWRTEIDENLAAFLARPTAFISPPPPPTASPISSTAAGRRDSSKSSTRTRSRSPTTPATGNTSRKAISRRIRRRYIFVMDYAHRRRVKLWGEARVVEDDPALMQSLMPKGYRARPEQVILFKIAAWDTNCPQHIPHKFDAADVAAGAGRARCADRRARGGAGCPEGTASAGDLDQAATASCIGFQANSG